MAEALQHIHPDDTTELLSGLLDDALVARDKQRADELVTTCPACGAEFRDLQAMQRLLRDLPPVLPPRSFTLDPAQYGAQAKSRGWFSILRFGGLASIAALLLVVVLANVVQRGPSTTATLSAPPVAQEQERSMASAPGETQVAAAAATSAPAAAKVPDPAGMAAATAAAGMSADEPETTSAAAAASGLPDTAGGSEAVTAAPEDGATADVAILSATAEAVPPAALAPAPPATTMTDTLQAMTTLTTAVAGGVAQQGGDVPPVPTDFLGRTVPMTDQQTFSLETAEPIAATSVDEPSRAAGLERVVLIGTGLLFIFLIVAAYLSWRKAR